MASAAKPASSTSNASVSRISVSLQPSLLEELDQMVVEKGYLSRSQAVSDMVNNELVEHKRKLGQEVMVGSITLHYDRNVPGLQKQLADLQYQHIDEVISSLHVQLSQHQVMEVILVQGRARHLQEIADEMSTRRGVISGRLQLLAAIMPPIQLPAAQG
jgi:CopG family nickel-responsive transcriptional regulator